MDQGGNRVRRWMWPNLLPEPQVPLSPIFISLNRHVGVRILAQDKIFISFLAMGRQAKLNMGTKVQVTVPVLSHSPQREWGSQGSSPLQDNECLSCGGCSLCCPMLCPQKESCGDALISAAPTEVGHLPAPALRKGPQCGTLLPGRSLATSPRSPWLCHREKSYDPCGQGARQLLSSAGSCHRGRFVCWRGSPMPSSGGSADTCPLFCRSAPTASCRLQPRWVRMSSCCSPSV